ncbi:MAG: S41 family peptidase [Alphaproteobacteria bacterium]
MQNWKSIISLIGFCVVAAPVLAEPQEQPFDGEFMSAEDVKADFTKLYSGLQSGHYDLYIHEPKSAYDALFRQLNTRITESMPRSEALLLFQEFTAFGRISHASIDITDVIRKRYRSADERIFPIIPSIVDGRFFVKENQSSQTAIKPGDEIISLNGRPMAAWLERLESLISGDTAALRLAQLEAGFSYWLLLHNDYTADMQVQVIHASGDQETYLISALNDAERLANQPESTNQFELPIHERTARMLDDQIAYLRPGPFYNFENPDQLYDPKGFVTFIDGAFGTFVEAGANALILDMRNNPGGSNTLSDPMVAWFADEPFKFASSFRVKSSPEAQASNQARLDSNPDADDTVSTRYAQLYSETPYGEVFEYDIPLVKPRSGTKFEGRVFALVDRQSYSQAVNVAATLQDYGFGIVLGEDTTDFATTIASVETFRLPISNAEVRFPKALIIRPSGDDTPGPVTPDVPIERPIEATESDVVLQRAVSHIKNDLAG